MPLNDKDLQAIDNLIQKRIRTALIENNDALIDRVVEYIDQRLKEERRLTDEKISLLPTKREFFDRVDQMLKKYETFEIEKAGLENKQSDHENRLERIESKLNLASS